MPDINMIQIHELNEASSVAATDVLAIDTGDATLKLKASKLTTGVKGNAESTYRTGNVNLTPANIGAVSKTGDTMTGGLTLPSIELKPNSGGAFIDFHYNGSSADYTVRLIEASSGKLYIKAAGDATNYPIALGFKLETTYDGSVYGSNIPYVPISGRAPQFQSLWFARNTTRGGNYVARCTTVSGNPAFALEYTLTGSAPQSGDNIIIMYFVI